MPFDLVEPVLEVDLEASKILWLDRVHVGNDVASVLGCFDQFRKPGGSRKEWSFEDLSAVLALDDRH